MDLARRSRPEHGRPLIRLRNEMDNLFGPFLADWSDWALAPMTVGTWCPALDIAESEAAVVTKVELPGLRKEDIELTAVDNIVTLKGERKHEEESTKDGYHLVERRHGQFQRSFEIPSGFDGSRIEAQYTDGVLKVTLPKREETKPKLIDVKVN